MTHLLAEGGYQIFTLNSSEKLWLYFALVCAVASIVVALLLVRGVLAADQGTASMKDIAKAIQEGAEAFLARQFKTIGIIIVPLAVLIFFTATKVTHTGMGMRWRRSRSTRSTSDVSPITVTDLTLRPGRHLPGHLLPGRRPVLGPDRLHRDEPGRPGQRPHRRRRP